MTPEIAKSLLDAITELSIQQAVMTTVLIHNGTITEEQLRRCRSEIERPMRALMLGKHGLGQIAELEKEFPGLSELAKSIQG